MNLTTVNIGANVISIPADTFYNCSSLSTVTFAEGSQLQTIGRYAFRYCSSLNRVNISDIDAWCDILFRNEYDNPLYYAQKLYLNGELATSLTISTGTTSIGRYAFYNCSSLQEITIPASVTSIGEYVFWDCSNLATVTFAESSQLQTIGRHAFYDCSSLNRVNISDIDAWCDILFGNEYANPLYYAQKLYLNGELATSLTISTGTTSIGRYAFSGCSSLQEITIPASVTSIGGYAFYNCYRLQEITIPASVTSIGGDAFYNCDSLQEIIIPASVTSIGGYAFYDCSNLKTVNIAENSLLQTIGDYAFCHCSSLQEITIPAKVTSIGYDAFYHCSNLKTVNIAEGSLLQSIGSYAFYNCSSLQEITIPASVTSIGDWAFAYCSSLKTVYYGGNQTQWGKIQIEGNNGNLTNATRYYYSANKPDGSELPVDNYWRYVDGKPTVWKEEDQ